MASAAVKAQFRVRQNLARCCKVGRNTDRCSGISPPYCQAMLGIVLGQGIVAAGEPHLLGCDEIPQPGAALPWQTGKTAMPAGVNHE